jgi:hypothetical protein
MVTPAKGFARATVVFGKYWRIRPLAFSLEPAAKGSWGRRSRSARRSDREADVPLGPVRRCGRRGRADVDRRCQSAVRIPHQPLVHGLSLMPVTPSDVSHAGRTLDDLEHGRIPVFPTSPGSINTTDSSLVADVIVHSQEPSSSPGVDGLSPTNRSRVRKRSPSNRSQGVAQEPELHRQVNRGQWR